MAMLEHSRRFRRVPARRDVGTEAAQIATNSSEEKLQKPTQVTISTTNYIVARTDK